MMSNYLSLEGEIIKEQENIYFSQHFCSKTIYG